MQVGDEIRLGYLEVFFDEGACKVVRGSVAPAHVARLRAMRGDGGLRVFPSTFPTEPSLAAFWQLVRAGLQGLTVARSAGSSRVRDVWLSVHVKKADAVLLSSTDAVRAQIAKWQDAKDANRALVHVRATARTVKAIAAEISASTARRRSPRGSPRSRAAVSA